MEIPPQVARNQQALTALSIAVSQMQRDVGLLLTRRMDGAVTLNGNGALSWQKVALGLLAVLWLGLSGWALQQAADLRQLRLDVTKNQLVIERQDEKLMTLRQELQQLREWQGALPPRREGPH